MRPRIPQPDDLSSAPRAVRQPVVPEKRVFAVLGALAALALGASVVVTWLASPALVPSYATSARMVTSRGVVANAEAGADIELPKRPLEMLPDFILGYETMARQAVPGQKATTAEAVYNTLSMNLDMLTKVSSYARVTGYTDESAARNAIAELMGRFPAAQADIRIGGAVMQSGYTTDRGAYVIAWSRGPYMTYVKSFFKDNVPAEKRDFLYRESSRIARAVELYQRTGKQGVEGNVATSRSATSAPVPDPDPVPGDGGTTP